MSRVFRKTVLDRLSSPEQLDQLVQITRPQGWIALGILSGVMIGALLWGWFGSVPVEITANGILQPSEQASLNRGVEALVFLPADAYTRIPIGGEARVFPECPQDNPARAFVMGRVRQVKLVLKEGVPRTQVEFVLNDSPNAARGPDRFHQTQPGSEFSNRVMVRIIRRSHPLELLIPGLRRSGGT